MILRAKDPPGPSRWGILIRPLDFSSPAKILYDLSTMVQHDETPILPRAVPPQESTKDFSPRIFFLSLSLSHSPSHARSIKDRREVFERESHCIALLFLLLSLYPFMEELKF